MYTMYRARNEKARWLTGFKSKGLAMAMVEMNCVVLLRVCCAQLYVRGGPGDNLNTSNHYLRKWQEAAEHRKCAVIDELYTTREYHTLIVLLSM